MVNVNSYEDIVSLKNRKIISTISDDNFYEYFWLSNGFAGLNICSTNCKNNDRDKIVLSVRAGASLDPLSMPGLAHLTSKFVLSLPSFTEFTLSCADILVRSYTELQTVVFEIECPNSCTLNLLKEFSKCFSKFRKAPDRKWLEHTLKELKRSFKNSMVDNELFQLYCVLTQLLPEGHPYSKFPHSGQLDLSTLEQINVDLSSEVYDFFRENYKGKRMRLLVRSSISPIQTKECIAKCFSNFNIILQKSAKNAQNLEDVIDSDDEENDEFESADEENFEDVFLPEELCNRLFIIPFQTKEDTEVILDQSSLNGSSENNEDCCNQFLLSNQFLNTSIDNHNQLNQLVSEQPQNTVVCSGSGLASLLCNQIADGGMNSRIFPQTWVSCNELETDSERHLLSIFWPLPTSRHYADELNSHLRYLSTLLLREDEGSLLYLLREKKLATQIECRDHISIGRADGFEILHVRLCLTNAGVAQPSLVLRLLDDYLKFICTKFPSINHYKEQANLSLLKLHLRNLQHEHMDHCGRIASELHETLYPSGIKRSLYICPLWLPDQSGLKSQENQMNKISGMLTCSRALIILQSSRMYDANTTNPIVLIGFSCKTQKCASRTEGVRKGIIWSSPLPNKYLPSTLRVLVEVGDSGQLQELSTLSNARLYFRCTQYLMLPLGVVHVRLITDLFEPGNALQTAAADLFELSLHQHLNEKLIAAKLSGFTYTLSVQSHSLQFSICGYSQKMRNMLANFLQQLLQLQINISRMSLLRDQLGNSYRNALTNKNDYILDLLKFIFLEDYCRIGARLSKLEEVDIGDLNRLHSRVASCTQFQCLVEGNFLSADAQGMVSVCRDTMLHMHEIPINYWKFVSMRNLPSSIIYFIKTPNITEKSQCSVRSTSLHRSKENSGPLLTSTVVKRPLNRTLSEPSSLNSSAMSMHYWSSANTTTNVPRTRSSITSSICSDVTCTSEVFVDAMRKNTAAAQAERVQIICNVSLIPMSKQDPPAQEHALLQLLVAFLRTHITNFFQEYIHQQSLEVLEYLQSLYARPPPLDWEMMLHSDSPLFTGRADVRVLTLDENVPAYLITLEDEQCNLPLELLHLLSLVFSQHCAQLIKQITDAQFDKLVKNVREQLQEPAKFADAVKTHWTKILWGYAKPDLEEQLAVYVGRINKDHFRRWAFDHLSMNPGFCQVSIQMHADCTLEAFECVEEEFIDAEHNLRERFYTPLINITRTNQLLDYLIENTSKYQVKNEQKETELVNSSNSKETYSDPSDFTEEDTSFL